MKTRIVSPLAVLLFACISIAGAPLASAKTQCIDVRHGECMGSTTSDGRGQAYTPKKRAKADIAKDKARKRMGLSLADMAKARAQARMGPSRADIAKDRARKRMGLSLADMAKNRAIARNRELGRSIHSRASFGGGRSMARSFGGGRFMSGSFGGGRFMSSGFGGGRRFR
jgi:hypothetical protein